MRYHDITKDDMKNGTGLRAVLWLSGCSHECKGCQNPITWDPDGGLIFDEASRSELYDILSREYIDGITLSGGDPLYEGNREEVLKLVKDIRNNFPDKSVWIYTGYDYEKVCNLEIMDYTDVLVDGPYIEEQRDVSLRWIGSANQRVIDVGSSKEEGKIVLYEKNC